MSMPSNISNGAAGPGQDGDVSMLSVATDASTTATSKPRVNGKTAKEENDSVGIDVCVNHNLSTCGGGDGNVINRYLRERMNETCCHNTTIITTTTSSLLTPARNT